MSLSLLLLNGIGVVLLLHAAYSCLHFRNLAADLELSDLQIPPLDVALECASGFLLLLLSQIFVSTTQLVPITVALQTKSLVAPAYQTRDFDIYSNRASAMKKKKVNAEQSIHEWIHVDWDVGMVRWTGSESSGSRVADNCDPVLGERVWMANEKKVAERDCHTM